VCTLGARWSTELTPRQYVQTNNRNVIYACKRTCKPKFRWKGVCILSKERLNSLFSGKIENQDPETPVSKLLRVRYGCRLVTCAAEIDCVHSCDVLLYLIAKPQAF